jgi:hypothetical protein
MTRKDMNENSQKREDQAEVDGHDQGQLQILQKKTIPR